MNRSLGRFIILTTPRTFFTLLSISLALLVGWFPQNAEKNSLPLRSLFDSPVKTVDVKPLSWVRANEGRTLTLDPITIIVPTGFTNQGGATVIGNIVDNPVSIALPYPLVKGTELALGIWPTQNQTQFQKPIELYIRLPSTLTTTNESLLPIVMMYNYASQQWTELPSQFDSKSRQISTAVQNFTPVPDNFPEWGGRTFFGVFLKTVPSLVPTSLPQVTLSPSQVTTVTHTSNLRAGPGAMYTIVGQASPGQQIEVIARTASSEWYKLTNGAWIAGTLIDIAQMQSRSYPLQNPPLAQAVEVAGGKPVFASSYWRHPTLPNWTHSPDKVIDRQVEEVNCRAGDHTYWLLPDKKTGWVQLDLENFYSIVRLRWLNTHNSQCNDRATTKLRIVLSKTPQFDSGAVEVFNQQLAFSLQPDYQELILAEPIQARYVRFYVDDYYKNGGGLNEIEVYANPGF